MTIKYAVIEPFNDEVKATVMLIDVGMFGENERVDDLVSGEPGLVKIYLETHHPTVPIRSGKEFLGIPD